MADVQYSKPLEAETDGVVAVMDFKSAQQLLSDPLSCVSVDNSKRHIMLPPRHLDNVVIGVREILEAELFKYCERLQGVPLAYDKLRFHGRRAHLVGSQPLLHFHVEAEYIVFHPAVDCTLMGIVNKVGRDHLGLLVHGIFNATVPKPTNISSQPPFALGQKIIFDVAKIYQQQAVVSMRGKLRPDSFSVASVRGMKRKAEELESMLTENFNEQTTPIQKKKRSKKEEVSMDTPDAEIPSNVGSSKKKKKKKRKSDVDASMSQSMEEAAASPNESSFQQDATLLHRGTNSSTPAVRGPLPALKMTSQKAGRLDAPDLTMSPITAHFSSSESGDSGIGVTSFNVEATLHSLEDNSISKDNANLSSKHKKKKKSKKTKS